MPSFALTFSTEAKAQLEGLRADQGQSKRLKSVTKAIGYLQVDPRHPGLQTHKYVAAKGPDGQDVFEAYAENRTPAAYRILWCYGPGQGRITILTITPHP
jgi:hypothetical protein